MRLLALSFLFMGAFQDEAPDDKKLAVPAVEEPEWPLPAAEEEIRKLGHSPIPGGGYQFEKRAADGTTVSGAVVPGRIMMNQGLIELLGCGEGGKEHESVLRIDCDIQSLDLALTLSGFRKGPVPAKIGQAGAQGARLVVLVQWKEKDKVVTRRAEDLVVSYRRGTPMPRTGWTYVAELVEVEDAAVPGKKTGRRVLAATGTRSLLTVSWNDGRGGSTLLDNPMPEANDDTSYGANHVVLPAMGTPVAVILRAPTAAEREEIAKVEKDLK